MTSNLRYAPEFRLEINGRPIPAALRASITSVSFQNALEGSDRVELSLVNENLRWLDDDLLALDNSLTLAIGYAPDPLSVVFAGEIVGQSPTFPGGGAPMLTVVAQDRRQRLQSGTNVRWFAISPRALGDFPMLDTMVAGMVAKEQGLIPIFDPIGAALSVFIGAVEIVVAVKSNDGAMLQKLIRKQVNESNYDFLRRISRENGWEMIIDPTGPKGGWQLRFMSLAEHLAPEVNLRYGQSLVDFTPRITRVGQIHSVRVNLWEPHVKMEFIVTASWDWESNALNVNVSAGFGLPGKVQQTPGALKTEAERAKTAQGWQSAMEARQKTQEDIQKKSVETAVMLVDEPVNQLSAPRVLLSKLLTRLNQRLTGSGSTIGDPRIKAGTVLRLEGIGKQFGGLYRVTSATHTINNGGYRTQFEVRKEIWFGSIPLLEQGAVKLNIPAPH